MPNDKSPPKPETAAQQETGGDCVSRLVGHSCSAQLISDWTDASIITIDGIDFAPVGYDGECGFSDEDLDNGLQLRIWEAVQLIASAFGGEVLDCRPNV